MSSIDRHFYKSLKVHVSKIADVSSTVFVTLDIFKLKSGSGNQPYLVLKSTFLYRDLVEQLPSKKKLIENITEEEFESFSKLRNDLIAVLMEGDENFIKSEVRVHINNKVGKKFTLSHKKKKNRSVNKTSDIITYIERYFTSSKKKKKFL